MLPTPQHPPLRSQPPILVFEKSEVPKDVGELYPGQVVLTFEKSEVPGGALFRLAAQILKVLAQKRPDSALRYENNKCQGEAIFGLGAQLWKILGTKCPHLFADSRVARQILDWRVVRQKKQSSPLLTYPELKSKKGISYCRQHIARLEKAGKFPRRIPISRWRFSYYEHEVDEWVRERADARIPTKG